MFATGQRVIIDDGPLLGREAIVMEERSARIVLLVKLATSVVPVEMDRDCIRTSGVPPQSAELL